MKEITFSAHAIMQIQLRGADEEQVIQTIKQWKRSTAKRGKFLASLDFEY